MEEYENWDKWNTPFVLRGSGAIERTRRANSQKGKGEKGDPWLTAEADFRAFPT